MPFLLRTPRLYLREMQPDDAPQALLLNADPEVLRYTGDAPFADEAAARRFLEQYDHYRRYGFGRWAVCRQEDDAFLGWCGLKYTEDAAEHDIGFRFFRQYWGQGYASEAARACISLGFEAFQLTEIVGRAMQENTASVKVLEKIGLKFSNAYRDHGREWLRYVVRAEEWKLPAGVP